MKLDCVLTACNTKPLYRGFIPLFLAAWNKLYPEVDVKILFIHDFLPEELHQFEKNIILFKPIDNVSTAFTSEYLRCLYPCILNYKNGVMITDIDDIPLSRYFTENIKKIPDDKWIYLRDFKFKSSRGDEIAICWQIATPLLWKEVFNIHGMNDIKNRLVEIYQKTSPTEIPGKRSWGNDQKELYRRLMKWNQRTGNYISLRDKDTGYARLDRIYFTRLNRIKEYKIKIGFYSDYHCLRPYEKYKLVNDKIVSLLPPPLPYRRYRFIKEHIDTLAKLIEIIKSMFAIPKKLIKVMWFYVTRIVRMVK